MISVPGISQFLGCVPIGPLGWMQALGATGAAVLGIAVAPQLLEGFAEGSGEGAATDAKPEIWAEMDKFNAAAKKMQDEMAKLNAAAKSGSLDAIKVAAGDVGKACKACHDDYRKE